MKRQDATSGQSLVEFALIFPLLFLLIVNVVNFGGFFYAWITVSNAARGGAQYMARGGATVKFSSPATAGQITALVTGDIASLFNQGSLQVRVCTKHYLQDAVCSGPGSFVPADDPVEAVSPQLYVLATVDVTYTYQPLIPLWEFPALGIHATLPATTIHRRSVMRVLQ